MNRRGWLYTAALSVLVVSVAGCQALYPDNWSRTGSADDRNAQDVLEVETVETAEAAGNDSPQPVAFESTSPQPAPAPEHRLAARPTTSALFGELVPGMSPTGESANGDNLRQITFTAEGGDFDPAIDPNGELLVFASTRHQSAANLYRKRVNGSTVTQLTSDPANDVTPAVSPDGSRIAFASDRGGTYDIYLMDARGGQAVQLTNDGTQDLHPSFSPDGRRLVYSSYGGPRGQWELVVIDLENPGTRQFIGSGLFPVWSPVDDRIVFQRARQRGSRWFSIWSVELDDGEPGSPTEIVASANAAVITPHWSPDGEHIVFCTVIDPVDGEARPSQADIWIVAADGSNRARLTSGRHANLQPVWASSGAIYFVSDRTEGGIETIWAARPDRALRLAQPRTSDDESAARRPVFE